MDHEDGLAAGAQHAMHFLEDARGVGRVMDHPNDQMGQSWRGKAIDSASIWMTLRDRSSSVKGRLYDGGFWVRAMPV